METMEKSKKKTMEGSKKKTMGGGGEEKIQKQKHWREVKIPKRWREENKMLKISKRNSEGKWLLRGIIWKIRSLVSTVTMRDIK